MGDSSALFVVLLFLMIGIGAWLMPKPPRPRKPDHIHEVYDL